MKEAITLDHAFADGRVTFEIPRLIVYGMSVIRLQPS